MTTIIPTSTISQITISAQRRKSESKQYPTINDTYSVSKITGGKRPIYDFLAPPEYLNDTLVPKESLKDALVYYFQYLYPATSKSKWENMTENDLLEYYKNLDFWYTFNTSWGTAPKPVVLDDSVLDKWEKNTFYQPNTIVQSSITSLSWDLDSKGQKFYYAARINNAAQVDPAYKFNGKTLRTVCRSKDFWESVRGNKLEVTNWGWNPYPFGVYLQGPFRGTGTFLEMPKDFVLGTCHWDIIMQNKSSSASRTQIFKAILDHELTRMVNGPATKDKTNILPWLVIREGNKYYWNNLLNQKTPAATPLIFSYSCNLIGGFGGIGGDGKPWDAWDKNYTYALLIDKDHTGKYTVPTDQSIPANTGLTGFSEGRSSNTAWDAFDNMFKKIEAFDTNFAQNIWRHPHTDQGFGMTVANPCDDLMQAYVTGNFNFVHYSIWGFSDADSSLCKNTSNPLTYSNDIKKFPYGYVTGGTSPSFVVRVQMPNVNGDICAEFADFRICTPGQLATGSGNQQEWKDLLSRYAAKYLYCADPDNTDKAYSLSGDWEPWFPDVESKKAMMDVHNFRHQDNPMSGKTFFDFDVYMGQWVANLAYTTKDDALPQMPMNTDNFKFNSWEYKDGKWNNLYTGCKNRIPNLIPKAMKGTELTLRNNYGDITCIKGDDTAQTGKEITYTTESYYPFATDSFGTGVVGYQANNFTASIGSCQTRWACNSKKVAWKFDAPAANNIIMNSGLRMKGQQSLKLASHLRNLPKIWLHVSVAVIIALIAISLYMGAKKSKWWFIGTGIGIIILALVISYESKEALVISDESKEAHRLRLYLSLVYPKTPISKWKSMSLNSLRKFYLSLHMWYRTDRKDSSMPKPLDYIDSSLWNDMAPFGDGSSWKNWTIRKKCVVGYPQVYNPYDGKMCIGNDGTFGMSDIDAPSTIMFRKRQILSSEGANVQQASFFQPANNYYIDTFNCHAGVNDTSIAYWEKVQYAEVSSQWGPFPDGSYHDWGQGTGIFMKLGRHIVGYTGMHVVYKLGVELLNKSDYYNDLEDVYFQEWQRTGINGMTMIGKSIINPGTGYTLGLYGSIIFTYAQREQIKASVASGQHYIFTYGDYYLADGNFWGKVNDIIKDPTPYYNPSTQKWEATIPTEHADHYIENYPFPLPFGTGSFYESSTYKGHAEMSKLAATMPWKYQCFNIAFMFRHLVIDLLFLNEKASNGTGTAQEYVDFLVASSKIPLTKPRTWAAAIDILVTLLGTTPIHPIFFKYTRTLDAKNMSNPLMMDGPIMILSTEEKPSLHRIQTGALDKHSYLQDTLTSNGVLLQNTSSLPQMACANLEIDHWMSELAHKLKYDSIQRIQHWSGSKNMSADIEIINLRVPIPGNLVDNVLTENIYEIWKKAFADGWYVLRDPFDPTSRVYPRDGDYPTSKNEETIIKWARPPWIGYVPKKNLYGWYPESIETFNIQNRLAYPQMGALQIGLSHSYPEYNHYIWEHFVRNY
jgi:hypothetical protein